MKKKLEVLIDAHCIGDKSGGNETYWKNLIDNIPNVDNYNNYTLKYNKNYSSRLQEENFKVKKYTFDNTFYRNLIEIPVNNLQGKFQVYHTQYFLPISCGSKTVVTIHDISFLHYPECFSRKQLLLNNYLIKEAAHKSKYIITVSEFSKKDIVEKYNIDPEKIFVTHLAANKNYKPVSDKRNMSDIIMKYNIKSKYILTVGNLQPRKNLERLIRAFNQLQRQEWFKEYELVIVGKKDWQLDKLFSNVEMNRNIVLTGYVPDSDLSLLYNYCDTFVYPSIFEGFGLPVLEALQCGKAVLTSNSSSLPEVIGDAGILFDPFDIEDIATSIANVLKNKEYRSSLEDKAIIQASKFTWEETALKTVRVYEKFNFEVGNNER